MEQRVNIWTAVERPRGRARERTSPGRAGLGLGVYNLLCCDHVMSVMSENNCNFFFILDILCERSLCLFLCVVVLQVKSNSKS